MPAKKIHILSPEAREACKQKIAEQNPSLEQGTFVYAAGDIPIAVAILDNKFQYLGPLAERDNQSSESNLKTLLFDLGIIDSKSASIEDLIVLDEQPSVAASKTPPPPQNPLLFLGFKKTQQDFAFFLRMLGRSRKK